jgi:uncharacterized tellurite resistance protein B-like protein
MIEKMKRFFATHISLTQSEGDIEDKLKVASAALLMEMMHTEVAYEDKKQDLIMRLLEKNFSLTEVQATALMEIAEHKREQATDYFEFTHLICIEFTSDQKTQLIEYLWRIALVDNNLDVDEEYLIDKVARLLLIPRPEVLNARNRVRMT